MSKRGYSLERFNARRTLPAIGLVPGTPVDLKSAAATVLTTHYVPFLYPLEDGVTDPLYIRAFGFYAAAAGGAVTTAGTMGCNVNGTALKYYTPATGLYTGSVLAVSPVTGFVSHAAGSVWAIEANLIATADRITLPPVYQVINPGDVVTLVVVTQGVGAGDQTIYPYLVVSEAAGQQQ